MLPIALIVMQPLLLLAMDNEAMGAALAPGAGGDDAYCMW